MIIGEARLKKEIYIPLLSDETTWDKSKKIIFLDEHFLMGRKDEELSDIEYEVIKDIPKIDYEELDSLSNEMCKHLAQTMNEIHCVDFPAWYWQKLMKRWMNHIIFSVYDKCTRINYILKEYDGDDIIFQNVIINNDIPYTFDELYTDELESDYHYLYTYKKIILYFGCEVEKDRCNYVDYKYENNITIKSYIKKFLIKQVWTNFCYYLRKIFRYNIPSVILLYPGFSHKLENMIINKSKGKIISLRMPLYYPSKCIKSNVIREYINAYLCANVDNEKWHILLFDVVSEQIPYCFLEGYKNILRQMPKALMSCEVKAILTLTGMYHPFINIAVLTAKALNGTKVLAIQHGGNYGVLKTVDGYDYLWDDVFYIWGKWCSFFSFSSKKLKWAPAGKFDRYKDRNWDKVNIGILIVGTARFRHDDVDHVYQSDRSIQPYINRQIKIIKAIDETLHPDITVRNCNIDYGMRINEYLKREFEYINFDENKMMDFPDKIQRCRLMIVDHISTTWVEALYLNKPFIIVINIDEYNFNPNEYEYMCKLRKVGIIRDVSELDCITHIYNNVNHWWNEPQRQKIIKEVRDRYCYGQDMNIDEMAEWWRLELTSYTNSPVY